MARRITPLRRAIFDSGMTQRDVAKVTGIGEKRLSLIVNGWHADDDTQKALAEALGQSQDDLFPEPAGEAA